MRAYSIPSSSPLAILIRAADLELELESCARVHAKIGHAPLLQMPMRALPVALCALAVAAVAATPPLAPPAAVFYVAPLHGDDNASGTSASMAFRTLVFAQQATRSATSSATVHLLSGDHLLPDGPLVFDSVSDSNVSWVGAGAASTVVRPGRRLQGWTRAPGRKGIWRAPNPFGVPFFQLVHDMQPVWQARHPNAGMPSQTVHSV